jgi:heptaprenyl diphosphate synthase
MGATKRLVTTALFTAASLMAGMLESRFPLPFPGMRLGLANIFTLTAMLVFGPSDAIAVAAARIVLSFLVTGNAVAMLCSVGGAAMSLPVTITLYRMFPDGLSVPAISAAGAYAFNFGQLAAIAIMLRTADVFGYLPWLLAVATATGFAIGRVAEEMSRRLETRRHFP